MSKINLFAVAGALILAGVGGWIASDPKRECCRSDRCPVRIHCKR